MRLLKTLLKWLAWVAGGLVGLVVLCYLALLAVNWRDRPPSETALRFAAAYRDRPAVADADNGYVYLSGLFVRPGKDPQVAGARRIAWIRRELAKRPHDYLKPPEANYDYKAMRSTAVQSLAEACREPGLECLRAMEQAGDTLEEWSSSERWLFDRYKTLLSHSDWLETVPESLQVPLPAYGAAVDGQRLLFVEAWNRAGKDDAAAVRNLLSRDVRFWRNTLECSDSLISKMIAVGGLRRHFKLANLVLRRLPAEREEAARPPEWGQELTRAERSMMRAWQGEWRFSKNLVEQGDVRDWWGSDGDLLYFKRAFQIAAMPLFQKQDFSNHLAEMFVKGNAELDVPYLQYRAAVAHARETLSGSKEDLPRFRLYNPAGVFVFRINGWHYESYNSRVVDIEGLRRAALLTSELRGRGVPAAQVTAELQTSTIRDPYSNEPFGWDAEKNALTFTGLESLPRGLHEFIY